MNRKQISWAMYDWANSTFSTTIMAGFFPLFFKQYWSAGASATQTTAALGMTLSISGALTAIASPLFGAWADQKKSKKFFCGLFMLLGVICSFALGFVPAGGWQTAMWIYGAALFAFSASCVFYDSLLPFIASGHELDRVSAIGYALGYLGGGILFLINVVMYLKPEIFGIHDGAEAVKWSFITVAVWWFLFSIPLFAFVPEPDETSASVLKNFEVFKELFQTLGRVFQDQNLRIFIIAYWLYIDGVYTVMSMAVDYGLALGLESSDLIKALLLVQFIGFPSTWVFGKVTQRFGNLKPILLCIGIYAVAVVLSIWMTQAWHFYALAVVIGLAQGGVQSLSRSLFCQMIPPEHSAEYFGFFNLIGKFASVLGPLIVAFSVTVVGDSRFGMSGLLVLFILGGLFLVRVREPQIPSPVDGL